MRRAEAATAMNYASRVRLRGLSLFARPIPFFRSRLPRGNTFPKKRFISCSNCAEQSLDIPLTNFIRIIDASVVSLRSDSSFVFYNLFFFFCRRGIFRVNLYFLLDFLLASISFASLISFRNSWFLSLTFLIFSYWNFCFVGVIFSLYFNICSFYRCIFLYFFFPFRNS